MFYISPIYLESASAVYAELFEETLHRCQWGSMGHWMGRGSKVLELKNPVQLRAMENLLNGLTPDGSRGLVPDVGDPKRVAGWLAVFNVPPRLNNEWGGATREAQIRVERGFAQGVNRTLRCWEDVVTGKGSLALRPETPKTVMAVFRTNVAWDQSPELKSTAIMMNMGLQALNQVQRFSPSQVMGLESGLRHFYVRALYACLDHQVGCLKTYASKTLGFNQLLKGLFDKAMMDSMHRSTWAHRDNRAIWENHRSEMAGNWRLDADSLAFKSYWTRNMQVIAKPQQLFSDFLKELRNGKSANGHAPQNARNSRSRDAQEDTKQQTAQAKHSKNHVQEWSH